MMPLAMMAVTAVPAANYHFVQWSGSIISTQNPLAMTMGADHTLEAIFVPIVPHAVGMTQAAATTTIEAVGSLAYRVSTSYSSTVTAGFVISQSPIGGTAVPVGSTIRMVVSLGPSFAPW